MRWLAFVFFALGAAGAGAWWKLDHAAHSADQAADPVDTEARGADAPAEAKQPERKRMLGVVVPAHEVYLAPAAFARVARVDVTAGQKVAQNQVLAQMQVGAQRSELAAARAAGRAARAQSHKMLVETERSSGALDRVRKLEGYVAQHEVDDLRHSSRAAVASRREAVASAHERAAKASAISQRIADATLRAPFSGVIVHRFAEPGGTLAAGEPVVHLISDERLVRFAVEEADAVELAAGAVVTIAFEELDFQVRGVVISVSPEVETTARIIMAEAKLDFDLLDADVLRTGTLARVTFGEPPPEPALIREAP